MWITAENAFLFLKVKKDDKLSVYLRSPSDVDERNNAVLQSALWKRIQAVKWKFSKVQTSFFIIRIFRISLELISWNKTNSKENRA